MELVLVIDPGERIGWAVGVITDGQYKPDLLDVTGHGIMESKDFLLALNKSIDKYDTVIVETWRLQPGYQDKFVGSDFPTVQVIGAIRFLSWLYPRIKIVWQNPAKKGTGKIYAKHHLPLVADLLDRLPKSHDDAHDGDAIEHLVAYYFNTRIKVKANE